MKRKALALWLVLAPLTLFGQQKSDVQGKPPITPAVFGKWAGIVNASVSNNGRYAFYFINDLPTGRVLTFLKGLSTDWQMEIGSNVTAQFSDDSKTVFFKNDHDSLAIFNVDTKSVAYISGVASFNLSKNENVQYLAYLLKADKKLVVKDLKNNHADTFQSVTSYFFSNDGSTLILLKDTSNRGQIVQSVDIASGKVSTIWTSASEDAKADNFIFAKDGFRLAFRVSGKWGKSIWIYRKGANGAEMVADGKTALPETGLDLEGIDGRAFADDGKKLFITLEEKEPQKPNPDVVGVDVWSYTDEELQPLQLKRTGRKNYIGILDIKEKQIARIQYPDDAILTTSEHYAIVVNRTGGPYDEWYWNRKAQSEVYLVNLRNGSCKLIGKNLPSSIVGSYHLSPAEKYVVYYDPKIRDYFSYEVATGKRSNITAGSGATWTTYIERDIPYAPYVPAEGWLMSWIKDDKAVLLYDQCDIFQADLSGKKPAKNLTGGYGRAHNIAFRFALKEGDVYNENEFIVLSAFNRSNKNDGFFSLKLGSDQGLQLLTMKPCMFKGTWEAHNANVFYPIKARDTNVYMVRCESAEESPNFFWTSDFKTFHRLTTLHPEKSYNWLTTQLIIWKAPDGSTCQGVLYKPENFDPKKKYPLLFYYYENLTERCFEFLSPHFTDGQLNIPYYVSNGYLVFTPDIHYKIGHTGQSVVNTIISAAKYLSALPYVDSKHMGIQGHSRGGWETNFLVTHTHLFAAAMSASGFCNYTNLYDAVYSEGGSRQDAYEMLFQRMGASLWKRPDLYVENSPIFKADKVTTPLLMMSNNGDNDVPFEQGVQFFTALRRLGKKVWMLQYDGEDHTVGGKAAGDLEIRMKQFFDHYLKGAPCPKWMLDGIPASRKGIDDGLELDTTGREPGPGLLKTGTK